MPPLAALLLWPVVCHVFFVKMRVPLAIVLSIVCGYLLLPTGTSLDLPMLPAFDKHSIPALTALGLALIFAKTQAGIRSLDGLWPGSWWVRIMIVGMVLGILATVFDNQTGLRYGTRYLQGMSLYDGMSQILSLAIVLVPLALARKFLAHPDAQRTLLWVLCIAAFGYSFLTLFEARMSPQLNSWVYGFFPHSWRQHYRGGDWRPIVFLSHGLLLGLFLAMATLAAAGLSRAITQQRVKYLVLAGWLFMTLIISNNLGAFLITIIILPVALLFGARTQLLFAVIIASIFLSYPLLRGAGLIPVDRVSSMVARIDPVRAESLNVRLRNEDLLLEKASRKPVFGWGLWGRSRVFDERGRDLVLADGYWVITIGVSGWVGYLLEVGLLTVPIFLLFIHKNRYKISIETSICALLLIANLIDLIPNSGMTPLTWLLAGALWGRLELGAKGAAELTPNKAHANHQGRSNDRFGQEEVDTGTQPKPVYTRQRKRIERKKNTAG
ncbi:hypothetical protein [uncultured Roseobacter sp.]|uniref:hypothetical protein n=1 Tax=uncultured Roseobacter sp. TaxID=114847 RepID=UPI002631F251|nr:hypothetical protein [uncultured Roseobacter sp.]